MLKEGNIHPSARASKGKEIKIYGGEWIFDLYIAKN